MQTKISPVTPESVAEAKKIIYEGGVVGMPTETVYGLGGNAFDDNAVKRIFDVKGRPNDNPLIAHVHTDYDLTKIIDYDPPYAKKLREAFLPGPLTLVYPSAGKVSPYVSCGLDTLAVRVPSHKGAQAFLKAVDIPIVAPSANLSKHVSPTSAQHVYEDFEGKIPLILDGGECEGGIESTVCDVTGDIPVILRPGLITREMIAEVVGDCGQYTPDLSSGEKVKSPGILYKHYSPRCQTALFAHTETAKAAAYSKRQRAQGKRVAILCEDGVKSAFDGYMLLNLGNTENEMAARLYALLREAEKCCDVLVAVEPKKTDGVMLGVLNRLRKACVSVDIPHK
jgi:L-threonylcarbamoyladenylate synthase